MPWSCWVWGLLFRGCNPELALFQFQEKRIKTPDKKEKHRFVVLRHYCNISHCLHSQLMTVILTGSSCTLLSHFYQGFLSLFAIVLILLFLVSYSVDVWNFELTLVCLMGMSCSLVQCSKFNLIYQLCPKYESASRNCNYIEFKRNGKMKIERMGCISTEIRDC